MTNQIHNLIYVDNDGLFSSANFETKPDFLTTNIAGIINTTGTFTINGVPVSFGSTSGSGITFTTGSNIELSSQNVLSVSPQGPGSGLNADLWDNQQSNISNPTNNQYLVYSSGVWTNQNLPSVSLSTLTDTLINSVSNGQILEYDGTLNKWFNSTPSLSLLSDISFNNKLSGQYLVYNGTNWINSTLPTYPTVITALSGLTSDVMLSNPSQGQYLTFNGAYWVNTSLTVDTKLSELSDVAISNISSNQYLVYNGASWTNAPLPPYPSVITALAGLTSDVAIAFPTSNQYLTYNGTYWTNTSLDLSKTLEQLTDVQITSSVSGQYLSFNGTNWINSNLPTYPTVITALSGLTSDVVLNTPTSGQYLTFDGSNWVNTNLSIPQEFLVNLGDVKILSSINGQVLSYNSTDLKWENVTLTPGITAISQLTDAYIDSPANGQYLVYNGTQWANTQFSQSINSLSDVSLSSPVNNDVLTYNSSTLKWSNSSIPPATDPRIAPVTFAINPAIQTSITGSMSIGDGSTLNSFNSLAIGYAAQVYDPAIGTSGTPIASTFSTLWSNGMMGFQLNTPAVGSGNYSVAIGYQASSLSAGSVAIGAGSNASGNYGTVLGYGATIQGSPDAQYSIAIGYGSNITASNSIVIGSNGTSHGQSSIIIGSSETNYSDHSIGIGSYAPNNSGDISIGYTSSSQNAVTIGQGSNMTCNDLTDPLGNSPFATCLGNFNNGDGNIQGSYSIAYSWDCNVLGSENSAYLPASTAIGAQCFTEIPGELAYNVGTFANNTIDNQGNSVTYANFDNGSTKISWVPLGAVTSPMFSNPNSNVRILNPMGDAKKSWNQASYSGNGFTLEAQSVYIIELDINAISNSALTDGLYAAYTTKFSVFTVNDAITHLPTMSPIIITTLFDTSTTLASPWSIAITIDNLNRVHVTVTGDGVNTIRWFAKAQLTKLRTLI
jgi:hypothetical protein